MSATPFPSTEQYLAMANKVDSRPSVALREIKRRLELTLLEGSPHDLIAPMNAKLGLTTIDKKIRYPKSIMGAPVRERNGFTNGITMGLSGDTEFEGNGQFKNEYSISIYSIDERIETEDQYWRTLDRIGLIRTALFAFMGNGGTIDPQNRVCWRSLVPMQTGFEMADWEEFGGIYCYYKMICDPSQNTWS